MSFVDQISEDDNIKREDEIYFTKSNQSIVLLIKLSNSIYFYNKATINTCDKTNEYNAKNKFTNKMKRNDKN